MNELAMMEAALFQLRAAVADDPSLLPIRLSADLVANAVQAAKDGVNAARVNDIDFALHDLMEATDDAGAPDAVISAIALLQNDVATLRAATALPPALVASIRELQAKLRVRASAMERAQYRAEGAAAAELPHPPEELRAAATSIAHALADAGFTTPSLDELLRPGAQLRYHTLNEVVDELDVIAGG
ncbi:MAG: hypothetical protein JO197_07975 [Acidobacteria bacterium]|nr:hypothetical protein [Acidobacteriota bacterium]MBV9475920.1 hypothetical protein [Acidobacteriota bacterium]